MSPKLYPSGDKLQPLASPSSKESRHTPPPVLFSFFPPLPLSTDGGLLNSQGTCAEDRLKTVQPVPPHPRKGQDLLLLLLLFQSLSSCQFLCPRMGAPSTPRGPVLKTGSNLCRQCIPSPSELTYKLGGVALLSVTRITSF